MGTSKLANTFIWNFIGTLKGLIEHIDLSVACTQQMFSSDQAQLALELSKVYRTADTLSPLAQHRHHCAAAVRGAALVVWARLQIHRLRAVQLRRDVD